MGQKRVIITVDRKKVVEIDKLISKIESDGFRVDSVDTIFDVTHISGWSDGDSARWNSDGVVGEEEGWAGPNQLNMDSGPD